MQRSSLLAVDLSSSDCSILYFSVQQHHSLEALAGQNIITYSRCGNRAKIMIVTLDGVMWTRR